MTKRVMADHAKSQKIMVYQSHAQNSSWSAIGSTHKSVVSVVRIIGWSLDLPASMIDSKVSTPCQRFLLILSIKIIASFTTIPVRAMNQIANGIE